LKARNERNDPLEIKQGGRSEKSSIRSLCWAHTLVLIMVNPLSKKSPPAKRPYNRKKPRPDLRRVWKAGAAHYLTASEFQAIGLSKEQDSLDPECERSFVWIGSRP
jgi:hypothetical protein